MDRVNRMYKTSAAVRIAPIKHDTSYSTTPKRLLSLCLKALSILLTPSIKPHSRMMQIDMPPKKQCNACWLGLKRPLSADKLRLHVLSNLKDAMKRGYSKLLIYKVVSPAKGVTSLMTTLDLQLMYCVSRLECTEQH